MKFIKFLYTKLAIDFLNHNSSTYVNVRKLFILFYIKKNFTYQKNFNIISCGKMSLSLLKVGVVFLPC